MTTERLATSQSTSQDAFAAAPKGAAARVLAAIAERPRCVDELMMDLRLSHSTCSAAMNKLYRDGWAVFDPLNPVFTMTRSGRRALVWFACTDPKPIRRTHPTRRELAERVESALLILKSDAPIDRSELINVLEGR